VLELKRGCNVLTPEAYKEFYSCVGEIRCIGKDWPFLDIKNLAQSLQKLERINEKKEAHLHHESPVQRKSIC
jgi:hypothetical protein